MGKKFRIEDSDLENFDSEIWRGSLFYVVAQFSHRSSSVGMIQAPYYELREKNTLSRVVPYSFIKPETLDIDLGEEGTVVSVGYDDGLKYLRIRWKEAFEIYYGHLICNYESENREMKLKDYFSFAKFDPKVD